jgi:hypothetical protein
MSSLEFGRFSSNWPHIVKAKPGKENENAAWLWINQYCWDNDLDGSEIYTTFSYSEFGFKDPKLAMEFKLRFG